MKLLLKYASRQRPELFKIILKKWRDYLSGKHDYQFLISLDTNDTTMNNPEIIAFLDQQEKTIYRYGNSKSKIEAINADMDCVEDFSTLVVVSDDMLPVMRGYDHIILSKMKEFFSDTFGVLHFNDGRVGQVLNTLSIMGKKMYDYYGYIYHPDFSSLWCDNEFQDTSVATGRVKYFEDVIITHQWINITGRDPLHMKNESFYELDKKVFEARKAKGFPKTSILDEYPNLKAERDRLLAR